MYKQISQYFHRFETESEFSDKRLNDYHEPCVSYTIQSERTDYNKWGDERYLTFDIISGGTIRWKSTNAEMARTISYKKNDDDWVSITSSTDGASISVNDGDIVMFKGTNAKYGTGTKSGTTTTINNSYFDATSTSVKINIYGNIMSLIGGDNFLNLDSFTENYVFAGLFRKGVDGDNEVNSTFINADGLILPATALTTGCYQRMFWGCRGLYAPPELPAMSLAESCYESMFEECYNLGYAPELPATTLAVACYSYMFKSCKWNLRKAPKLNAMNLAMACYYGMFFACENLNEVQNVLPAEILTDYCYAYMFRECYSLTTAPELPAMSAVSYCYEYMFQYCTSLTTAPPRLAYEIAPGCYYRMFEGCSALEIGSDMLAVETYDGYYSYYQMYNGCNNLKYLKCLAYGTNVGSFLGNFNIWIRTTGPGTFICDSRMENIWNGSSGWAAFCPTGWTRIGV